jgi:CubicO group peptidase (beta-lactamase class C family)
MVSDVELPIGRLPRGVGVVVGVDRGGDRRLWSLGDPLDRGRTIFEIGSVTKAFTGLLLADLAREGLVRLDDPVQDHLPSGWRMHPRASAITLEDLACHRSGLPSLPLGLRWSALTVHRRDPYRRFGDRELARALRHVRPGTAPRYSNLAVGLLGRALAHHCGTTYGELVGRRVCAPLRLSDTRVPPADIPVARLAAGHGRFGGRAAHWHFGSLVAAGGLHATAPDLLSFVVAHLGRALSPLAAAGAEAIEPRAWQGGVGIGLGWGVLADGPLPTPLIFHEGMTGGFSSFVAGVPGADLAVVALANRAHSLREPALRAVAQAARG